MHHLLHRYCQPTVVYMGMDEDHIADNDTARWNRFRQGDEMAYNALMRSYATPLFVYGQRFSTDREFVKDCIQDVFFELWHRRANISATVSVKSYLFKALRLRIFRQQGKNNHLQPLQEEWSFLVEFTVESKLIAEQTARETAARIQKILNTLPPRQKEIITLRFYDNLNYEEIAFIMGLSRQSVYNLVQKALLRFRKEWLQQYYLYGTLLGSLLV